MNRKARRQQKAAARKATVDRIVAVHEAGHAVGRYLTAGLMGLSVDKAIAKIVIRTSENMPESQSIDGYAVLKAQATTYGPIFSSELAAAVGRIAAARGVSTFELYRSANTVEARKRLMSEAAAQGCNVRQWVWARAIIAVAGPTAEAAYRRVEVTGVLYGYEGEEDLRSIMQDAVGAGLSTDEAKDLIDQAIEWFERQPGVFDAVGAVAAQIKRPGTISGATAVRIIDRAMSKLSSGSPPSGA